MRLRTQYLTKNECYQAGRTIRVKGVMVHSTGANNPRVARYVPGDEEVGRNTSGNHWDRPGLQKCVHAFVGKFADGGVGTVQTLPWDRRGWHAGGNANNTHIGFEICEDGLDNPDYFKAVYQEAVELTAMLCKEYGLDPLADGVIICHQEGYRRGVASNHGDVLHWFPKFGKSMDDFREEVARICNDPGRGAGCHRWDSTSGPGHPCRSRRDGRQYDVAQENPRAVPARVPAAKCWKVPGFPLSRKEKPQQKTAESP